MVQLAPRFAILLAFCFLVSATPLHPSPYISASVGLANPTPVANGTHANHTARGVAVLVANNTAVVVGPTASPHATHANNTSKNAAVTNKHPLHVIEQHPGSQSYEQAQGQDPVCRLNSI